MPKNHQPAQPEERYINLTNRKRYLLILEIDSYCELEGIDRCCIQASRANTENNETWERQP